MSDPIDWKAMYQRAIQDATLALSGKAAAEARAIRTRLTDEEREAISRLSPSGDPDASRTVTLTPAERKVFHGLLERLK